MVVRLKVVLTEPSRLPISTLGVSGAVEVMGRSSLKTEPSSSLSNSPNHFDLRPTSTSLITWQRTVGRWNLDA
jgi:hypothetical protein